VEGGGEPQGRLDCGGANFRISPSSSWGELQLEIERQGRGEGDEGGGRKRQVIKRKLRKTKKKGAWWEKRSGKHYASSICSSLFFRGGRDTRKKGVLAIVTKA